MAVQVSDHVHHPTKPCAFQNPWPGTPTPYITNISNADDYVADPGTSRVPDFCLSLRSTDVCVVDLMTVSTRCDLVVWEEPFTLVANFKLVKVSFR